MNQALYSHHAVMSLRPNYKALLLTIVSPRYRNVGKALKAMGIPATDAADKQPKKNAKYRQSDYDYIAQRRAEGATWAVIGEEFGVDPGTVFRVYQRVKKQCRQAV